MLKCSQCSSSAKVKSGALNDRQHYKCEEGHYLFTVHHKSGTATPVQRRMAVTLYLEALSMHSIGCIVGFRHVAVYLWIRALGAAVAEIKRPAAQIVDLDELHSYVGHKKLLPDLACC